MTLDQINRLLTERGVVAAVKYAKANGFIHHKGALSSATAAVRRVALHMNDDGTAYIVLHNDMFAGKEATCPNN